MNSVNFKRLAGAAVAAVYVIYCLANSMDWHIIDSVDLVIHEAGHIIFIFFGDFIHVLGGSLLQVLLPAIFAGYFFMRRDLFSGAVVLMWVGYSIVNVSIYMGDAVTMQLPLLGGDGVIHDWNYVLSHMGLLGYTNVLAHITYFMGLMTVLFGIVISIRSTIVSSAPRV